MHGRRSQNDGMSGEELIDVRQNGDLWWLCPDGETRTQARIDIPQVMVKLVEAVRTILVDMQVPKFGKEIVDGG